MDDMDFERVGHVGSSTLERHWPVLVESRTYSVSNRQSTHVNGSINHRLCQQTLILAANARVSNTRLRYMMHTYCDEVASEDAKEAESTSMSGS